MNVPLMIILAWMANATLEAHPPKQFKQAGIASWYGAECSKTASGEHYNCSSFTAAHRTLPFGTMVEVHNLANGRSVTVRINNRGPFCKGRVLDLSKAAAQQLQMIRSGTARVELAVLQ